MKQLLENDANILAKTNVGIWGVDPLSFLSSGGNLSLLDSDVCWCLFCLQKGHTAFHKAAIKGHLEVVTFLAEKKGKEIVTALDSVSVRLCVAGCCEGDGGLR